MEIAEKQLATVFAHNLRRRRHQLGLTQTKLGELIGSAHTRIAALERGVYTPHLSSIAILARALDTTPAALLTPGYYDIDHTTSCVQFACS